MAFLTQPDLTIFVSTFNRLDTLALCLHHLEAQQRPKRIVIVDNGSKHPAAIDYLKSLERTYTVYWLPAIEDVPTEDGDDGAHGGPAMQAVQRNVTTAFRRELEQGNESHWFGMTDADVHLDGRPDSLDAYIKLAQRTGRAVGPHLRLNVHRNYPLRSAALILNARVLFKKRMSWFESIPYSPDDIDTTFHLFRASDFFARLQMDTARVGHPWMATHSDWCLDFSQPTLENHAYILGCGEAASWGGRWIKEFFVAWLRSPEHAFEIVEASVKRHDDYFYPWFMLAWMLQYGHGCQRDVERSRVAMRNAIPVWSPCHDYSEHWDDLVYWEDFTCLGWG